ncbi:MAG: hypothetical protein Q8R31_07515 [Candidatus Omnitrophota bacterium]|nr:hypothetical protein [Candidatus Omnitrophota bacterium]
MKQKIFLGLVAVALLCATPVLALDKAKDYKGKEEAKEPALTPVETARQEQELLIANINNMRNQELRVTVLQQLLNEEVTKLRNLQAVFCDTYKLDIEKFRMGQYRYDERQGKFVIIETKPAN